MGLICSRPPGNRNLFWLVPPTARRRRHRRRQASRRSKSPTRQTSKDTNTSFGSDTTCVDASDDTGTVLYPKHNPYTMPNPHNPTPAQLDAWLLEDIQIRKLHLNPSPDDLLTPLPTHTHTDMKTTTTTTITTTTTTNTNTPHGPTRNDKTHPHAFDPLAKDHTALRLALSLSRQHETDRQAVAEQHKLEALFHEAKERRQRRERERKDRWEREREEVERKLELEVQRERERVLQAEVQMRERDVERVLREAAEAKVLAEREVIRKVKELEEAAVSRAVEESIISEAARKLIEQGEREKRRVEGVAERMRVEAEARAQEERLRRRVEGKKGREWARGGTKTVGFDESAGLYGPGFPPLGPRVADVRAFFGDYAQRGPFPTTGSYSTTYAGNNGLSDPPPGPTWYGYTAPLTASTSARRGSVDSDTLPPRRWDRGPDFDSPDETYAAGWPNTGRNARYWRETTTERWETTIRDEGRDAYRRYKETSKSSRRFL